MVGGVSLPLPVPIKFAEEGSATYCTNYAINLPLESSVPGMIEISCILFSIVLSLNIVVNEPLALMSRGVTEADVPTPNQM